jgi:archaellum component FlaC
MSNEFEILMDMLTHIDSDLNHFESSKQKALKIKESMKHLNTNYFKKIQRHNLFRQYLEFIDDAHSWHNIQNNLQELKSFVKEQLKNRCNHIWITDLIDIDPDRSKTICYCSLCEVEKRL